MVTKKRLNQDDDSLTPAKEHVKILASQHVATHYRVFLNKPVEEPSRYEELIQVLLTASEDDCVEILCNSTGGQLDSCIDIVNAIRESRAATRAVITCDAHSAMSAIALACLDCVAMPHSAMLVHQPRGGNFGRHAEQVIYGEFVKKHTEGFYKDIYKDFLTDKEITECLNGKDFWFDSEEINQRLNRRSEIQQKAFQKQLKEAKENVKLLDSSSL